MKTRSWIFGLLMAATFASGPAALAASSLQISPVNIEVPAPGAVSRITLNNMGDETLNARIRIYKWVQINGKDKLAATRDVVASPPALKLERAGTRQKGRYAGARNI